MRSPARVPWRAPEAEPARRRRLGIRLAVGLGAAAGVGVFLSARGGASDGAVMLLALAVWVLLGALGWGITAARANRAPPPASIAPRMAAAPASSPAPGRVGPAPAARSAREEFHRRLRWPRGLLAACVVAAVIGTLMLLAGERAGLLPLAFPVLALIEQGAKALARRRRPPSQGLALRPDRLDLRRGERLSIEVELPPPTRPRQAVVLSLTCTEFYVARETEQGVIERRVVSAGSAWSTEVRGVRGDFPALSELEVPADAPYTYDGVYVSYCWKLELRTSERYGVRSPTVDAELVVRP